jgi:hypothetical protein
MEKTNLHAASHWQTISHIKLYRAHLAISTGFNLKIRVVIDTDCRRKYNDHNHNIYLNNISFIWTRRIV